MEATIDRGDVDVEGTCDVADGLAFFDELASEGTLVGAQFGRTAEGDAARLCGTASFLGSRGDEGALELRDAGEDGEHHAPTAAGRLVFGIFAALAEFERELIRERTVAGLKAVRARGRKGGRKFALSKAQVRLAQAAMASRDTSVSELCAELGIKPVTLYRYVGPRGELRDQGAKVLAA